MANKVDDEDEENYEDYVLDEDQEEAVEMIRQAVYESGDTEIPEEVVILLLLKMASELAAAIGIPKSEFIRGTSEVYDDTYAENLIEHASSLEPIDE